MNIIWITLESILPANSGGRLGVFKRLEQISKCNEVYLYYPYDNLKELEAVEQLQMYCKEVHPYYRKKKDIVAIAKIAAKMIRNPYTVASRCIDELQTDVNKCIKDNDIQLINIDFPHMCVNLRGIECDKIPVVLNEHNIEWKVYKNIGKSQKNILKKILYLIDSHRLKEYESRLLSEGKISKLTFVSEKDMNEMIDNGIVDRNECALIPVGADNYSLLPNKNKEIIIAFIGKMSYAPNIEAAEWFVKEIFPKIKKKIDKCKFYIVGKNPSNTLLKLACEDVIVTGMVDSVQEYYQKANLIVLPLKNGGGVKVKLLEALGYNKKIVSTSIGVEGTMYADNKMIPVSDDAEEFATFCINALMDEEWNKEGYIGAREKFLDNYTWKIIGKKYNDVLKKVAELNAQ